MPLGLWILLWDLMLIARLMASQVALILEDIRGHCMRHKKCDFSPCIRKIPWRRSWQPTPVFLPGDPMDRGAWRAKIYKGPKESNTTEAT